MKTFGKDSFKLTKTLIAPKLINCKLRTSCSCETANNRYVTQSGFGLTTAVFFFFQMETDYCFFTVHIFGSNIGRFMRDHFDPN